MVLFNHATRELTAKIVYYGPGLCGKTTNLMVIFDKLDPKSRGKMLSLATKTDRTLFFDLLPVDIGKVGAFNLKIQLYTVPGQVFYNETRKLVLKGADAVVFVADSQSSMVESNRESFANLMENLEQNQIDANDIPIVIQFNKRDLPNVLPVEQLQEQLGFDGYPFMEASAVKGDGVMETFKLVSKITAKNLIGKFGGGKSSPKLEPVPKPAKRKIADELEKLSTKSKSEPAPPPPPLAQPPDNPFASSFDPAQPAMTPFPEASYEKVEEVSLEQLLEGRERPATFSGNIAIPVEVDEEIEELHPASVIDDGAVAVAAKPRATAKEANSEVDQLRSEVASLKRDQKKILAALDRIVTELTDLIRAQK
jgi:signal recognition particle receptor subunit beta